MRRPQSGMQGNPEKAVTMTGSRSCSNTEQPKTRGRKSAAKGMRRGRSSRGGTTPGFVGESMHARRAQSNRGRFAGRDRELASSSACCFGRNGPGVNNGAAVCLRFGTDRPNAFSRRTNIRKRNCSSSARKRSRLRREDCARNSPSPESQAGAVCLSGWPETIERVLALATRARSRTDRGTQARLGASRGRADLRSDVQWTAQ